MLVIAVCVTIFVQNFIQISPPITEEIGYMCTYINYDHYSKTMRFWRIYDIFTFCIFWLDSKRTKWLPKCFSLYQEKEKKRSSISWCPVESRFCQSFPCFPQLKHRRGIIFGWARLTILTRTYCCAGFACFVFVTLLCRDWLLFSIPVSISIVLL